MLDDGIFFFRLYNPYDWYWHAIDGRVYSSARQAIVGDSDSAYLAWGGVLSATPWPRDSGGIQTTLELQTVMDAYGLSV